MNRQTRICPDMQFPIIQKTTAVWYICLRVESELEY